MVHDEARRISDHDTSDIRMERFAGGRGFPSIAMPGLEVVRFWLGSSPSFWPEADREVRHSCVHVSCLRRVSMGRAQASMKGET